ncbi:MAG: YbjN domain-containing protein [Spirochaetales bacterium]|nr:YbjN domain-containing protein [Spirochaetales bacterium]
MAEEFTRIEEAPAVEVVGMVEQLLKDWNIDPASVKDPDKNLWYLMQGSAKFHIELFKFNKGPAKGDVECIEIGGTIMKLPQENFLPLYRRLLDLNSTAVGVYFAIRKNLVMLLATREINGMDYAEFRLLVDEVRYFSDHWDDILMKEFGGSK